MADERDDRKTQAYIDDALGRFLRIQDKVERSLPRVAKRRESA